MIKITGYYNNVKPGIPLTGLPDLDENTPKLDSQTVKIVAAYLNSGTPVVVSPGYTKDIFDNSTQISFDTMTDGEWIWPKYSAYYCEAYGISPDPELVQKAIANNGICPPVDESRVLEVDRESDELVQEARKSS